MICLTRRDAGLRSHRPISHKPVMPASERASSSSSGISSSLRMERPYFRDSWSSQTEAFLAMRTREDIQSTSGLKFSGSGSSGRGPAGPPKRASDSSTESAPRPGAREGPGPPPGFSSSRRRSSPPTTRGSGRPRTALHRARMYSSCPLSEWGEARTGSLRTSMRFRRSGPNGGWVSKNSRRPERMRR